GQNNMRYCENGAQLPSRELQGSQDDPRLLRNLHVMFDRLHKLPARDAQLIEFADKGHDFDLGAVDWKQFFTARRQPVPAVVVRTAADRGEARAAWAEILAFEPQVAVEVAPAALAGDPGTLDRLDDK